MVSKAHHYGVSRLAKASSRRMLECVMEQPINPPRRPYKKSPVVEVHVMFDPSRLAQQCLADAYACLIPTVRRRLGPALPTVEPAPKNAERNAQ